MAKNCKLTRTISDTVKIKGVVSDDGTEITYVEGKDALVTVKIADYLAKFAGTEITFSATTREESELDEE